ncbi:ATP--guanido phosphotransferase [Elusimicrobiota bacterium]
MFQLTNLLKNQIGWLDAKGSNAENVVASRIRFARNLAFSRFPHKASSQELKAVLAQVSEAVRKAKEISRLAYVQLGEISQTDARFLVERHLISADLAQNPQNRAVFIGNKETISIMVNEEDHLRIQVIAPGLNLTHALKTAIDIDAALGKELAFAYRDDFGFLASCPTNLGTGMRASALIHLPSIGLAKETEAVLRNLSRLGLVARGFYGEGSQVFGDLFQISNATSLGKSETEFTDIMTGILKNVINHDAKIRDAIFKGPKHINLHDKIWRAYGTLSNARLISYKESMQELSLLRLGLSNNIRFDKLNFAKLNEVLILTQPAHIQIAAGEELSPQERDISRADLIRKILS